MVDVSLFQSLSYIAVAIGVCVAAFYYALNLRGQRSNRRVALTQSLIQNLNSVETLKIQGELMNMEWSDYDDFERKYGSDYNLDNYTKRMHFFYTFEAIGDLLRAGMADPETLYGVTMMTATGIWQKFLPTIAENRRRYTGKDGWSGFEYMFNELVRIRSKRDPDYVWPKDGIKYVQER